MRSRSVIVGNVYDILWLIRRGYLRHTEASVDISRASGRRSVEIRRRRRLILQKVIRQTREGLRRARGALWGRDRRRAGERRERADGARFRDP
jgi:hypothetical protein